MSKSRSTNRGKDKKKKKKINDDGEDIPTLEIFMTYKHIQSTTREYTISHSRFDPVHNTRLGLHGNDSESKNIAVFKVGDLYV